MNSLKTHAKIAPDQSMDIYINMFRLFLKDTQTTDGSTSLLAKEFQYLLCNPKIELAEGAYKEKELGQLEVKVLTNAKENATNVDVLFTDFRINLAFPTVKAVLIFVQKLQKLGDNVLSKMEKMQNVTRKDQGKEIAEPPPKKQEVVTKPPKGSVEVNANLMNVEAWLPDDPTQSETIITKFGLSGNARMLNFTKESGEITSSVGAKLAGLSLIFAKPDHAETIMKGFDINLGYKETVGVERDIIVDIQPIEIKLTLNQLRFFQHFLDKMTGEVDSLQLGAGKPAEQPQPPQPGPSPEQRVEQLKESLNMKLKVNAKMELVKLILEDDLAKYPYPLIRIWAGHIGADVLLDPEKGKQVSVQIFEIALELGSMFDQDEEKREYYERYFRSRPRTNIEAEMESDTELYKEIMGVRINGLEANVSVDPINNIKSDVKMWRFFAKDRQVVLRGERYKPRISSDFQDIIANPQIEELCRELEEITNYTEKVQMIKERLEKRKLSQLHLMLELKKNEETNVNLVFSDFCVTFAAQTIASLAKTLEQVNNIQNNLLPQVMASKSEEQPPPPQPPPSQPQEPQTEAVADAVLGKDTKVSFRGELSNITLLLPKTGLVNNEKVAKFSLTTRVDLNTRKSKGDLSTHINARVEEICLELMKEKRTLDTLIPRTRIALDLSDDIKESGKEELTKIMVVVDPIKLHLAFRHLHFFAQASAGILANLPSLQQAGQQKPPQQPQPPPAPTKGNKTTLINAELGLLEAIIFDDSQKNHQQYPWVQMALINAGGALELKDFEGKKEMKGVAILESLRGEIAKKITDPSFVVYVNKFKESHDESVFPYMTMLKLGFEGFKAEIKTDPEENTALNAHLHRLYLKDTQLAVKDTGLDVQIMPAIAPDFQDILSNPLVEKSGRPDVHQLEVKVNMSKKEEETNVHLVYSDFRIVVAPPAIIGLLETMNLFLAQMNKINEASQVLQRAKEMQQPSEPQPEKVKVEPAAALPTKKLKFTGEVTNIEIWVPRTVETNLSRICQLSLSVKLGFSSLERSKDSKLLNRNTVISAKMFQLAFVMINKHLLNEGDPVAAASREIIMPPARLSVDLKRTENTEKDQQTTNISGFIEPISITVGFREIVFFKALAEYYQTKLIAEMPKTESAPKAETQQQPQQINYGVSTTHVDLKVDPLNLVLSDDTGIIEQHLFKLLLTNLALKFSMTELLDEEKREHLKANKEFMLANAKFAMEVLFYNNMVAEYEPAMESWGLECVLSQSSPEHGKEIAVKAEKMLNLNLSYAAAKTIGLAWKRMNEGEEHWAKEREEYKTAAAQDIEKLSIENIHTDGFIFENRLGYPINFCLQSISGEKEPKQTYHKFTLGADSLMFLSKMELKKMRRQQASTEYGQSLKLISEDVLRIIVQAKGWKYSPGIPIELAGCHSFLFKHRVQETKSRFIEYRFPTVCRVRSMKSHKVVTFESPIVLANNSSYDLVFYSPEYGKSCTILATQHIIDVESVTEIIEVKANSAETVPYRWLCENRDIGVLCRKDDAVTPLMLIQGLMKLFKLKISEASEKDLRCGKIPLSVSTSDNIQPITLACDIAAFTCHKVDPLTPLQYVLSFNTPLLVQNYLPRSLEVSYKSPSKEDRLVGIINRQEAIESYVLDADSLKNVQTTWKIHMSENSYFYCDAWSTQTRPNEIAEQQLNFLLHDPEKAEKAKRGEQTSMQIKATIRPNNILANKYDNFTLREKVFENCYSKKIVLFARNAIVNKTDFSIEFGDKDEAGVLMLPHSNCLCSLPPGKKLSFRVKGFSNIY